MFGPRVPVATVNSVDNAAPVYVTADDRILCVKGDRAGGLGGYNIWEARRPR